MDTIYKIQALIEDIVYGVKVQIVFSFTSQFLPVIEPFYLCISKALAILQSQSKADRALIVFNGNIHTTN